jgi:hypothetical protein
MSDSLSPQENPAKDPADWTTGGEPMTGPQRSYLQTLAPAHHLGGTRSQ